MPLAAGGALVAVKQGRGTGQQSKNAPCISQFLLVHVHMIILYVNLFSASCKLSKSLRYQLEKL
jgi:hypothetical protein